MGFLTSTTAPLPLHHRTSNYDELSMHQSLLFADSLKDLKNLRTQLYAAAEYFELSYTNNDHKQLVIETLKDYSIKALVNTVDHLGSVTYKVNDILDEQIEEVSETELHLSCIERRLGTCQEYIEREGMAQQSSVTDTPRYNKRYVLPAGQTMTSSNLTNLEYKSCDLDEDDWLQFRSAVRATFRETPSTIRETPPSARETLSMLRGTSSFRRGRSTSPAPRPSHLPGSESFSFASSTPRKVLDKRSVSISPHRFPLLRSGSLASRPITPKSSRPTTPKSSHEKVQHLPDSWKSMSMRVHDEAEKPKEIERHPSKSKRLLKALLSKRKLKKDETLFTFLDEY